MISKLFLIAILLQVSVFADHEHETSSEEEHHHAQWEHVHHLHWHVIPRDENAAKEWSEKAGMPWEQTKKIMEWRAQVREATSWSDKLKKMREACEYITTTPTLDTSAWSDPEEWKTWKKTWIDISLKMAHWAGKISTAKDEREKMTLMKKVCWEMTN